MRKIHYVLSTVLIVISLHAKDSSESSQKDTAKKHKQEVHKMVRDCVGRVMSNIGANFYNLLSWDTFKTGCVTLPFYVGARPVDHKIHEHFYNSETHKNLHQPPAAFAKFAVNTSNIVILIVFLRDFFSSDLYHRRRGEIFMTGLGITWITKNILKCAHIEGNKRPWNEHFSKHHCTYGGSPSGHSALFGYVTSFWFVEKGPLVGVPLVIASALGMAVQVISNRHYLSQVILGAGYGVMLGLAAHKTLEKSIFNENTKVGLVADPATGVGFKLSYNF